MKTAMQEFVNNNFFIDADGEYILKWIEDTPLTDEINETLKKEKKQIMNAYCDGAKGGANGSKGQHENGYVSIHMREKYYNQKYNKS